MQTPTIARLNAIAARINRRLNTDLRIEKGSKLYGQAWKLCTPNGSQVYISAPTKTEFERAMFHFIDGMDAMAGYTAELIERNRNA